VLMAKNAENGSNMVSYRIEFRRSQCLIMPKVLITTSQAHNEAGVIMMLLDENRAKIHVEDCVQYRSTAKSMAMT